METIKIHTCVEGSIIGYGISPEEAAEDCHINKVKSERMRELDKESEQRLDEIKPWCPNEWMLHLSGIGCIYFNTGALRDTRSERAIVILNSAIGKSIYYFLAQSLGDQITYREINTVLGTELDKFFQGISTRFISLFDYPTIQLKDTTYDFEPEIRYVIGSDVVIGQTETEIGIAYAGTTIYYTVSTVDFEPLHALAYIAYRMGVVHLLGGI